MSGLSPLPPCPLPPSSALELAIAFHNEYERLAPSFGYETRKETRKFDPATPNGQLMIAVCQEIARRLAAPLAPEIVAVLRAAVNHIPGNAAVRAFEAAGRPGLPKKE